MKSLILAFLMLVSFIFLNIHLTTVQSSSLLTWTPSPLRGLLDQKTRLRNHVGRRPQLMKNKLTLIVWKKSCPKFKFLAVFAVQMSNVIPMMLIPSSLVFLSVFSLLLPPLYLHRPHQNHHHQVRTKSFQAGKTL